MLYGRSGAKHVEKDKWNTKGEIPRKERAGTKAQSNAQGTNASGQYKEQEIRQGPLEVR